MLLNVALPSNGPARSVSNVGVLDSTMEAVPRRPSLGMSPRTKSASSLSALSEPLHTPPSSEASESPLPSPAFTARRTSRQGFPSSLQKHNCAWGLSHTFLVLPREMSAVPAPGSHLRACKAVHVSPPALHHICIEACRWS